ncbi:MAG TPA: hypothetical protein VGM86_14760 [Thermoanaerobaculia bacterium]
MTEDSSVPALGPRARRFLELTPVAVWLAIAAAFFVRLGGASPDDFYITYRYARNLAEGLGFVFNPGERVFGSTDPGLALLLGALHAVTGAAVPWIAAAIFSLSLLGVATLLFLEGRERGHGLEAILGGSLLLVSSYFWLNQGAAGPLVLFLLLLAAALSERSEAVAGLLAGAAAWVRPDAMLGVALLALLLTRGKRLPWRYILAAGGVVAAGVGLAWLYFGSPLPNTLGAKTDMAAATPGSWVGLRFWSRAMAPLNRHFGAEWPLVLLAGAAGCAAIVRMNVGRGQRLLAFYGVAIALAYPLLGVPFFSWYILPCLAAAIYGLAFFAGAAGGALAKRSSRPALRPFLVAGIFLVIAFSSLRASWAFARDFAPAPYLQSYRRGAEWIKANSKPGDAIAYVEIGVLGYYSERPILDLMGLVTPWVRPFVVQRDILGAFKADPTEFVLFHTRGRMAPIVRSRWFKRRYQEVMQFEDPGGKGILHIYRRFSGAEAAASAAAP